MIISYLFTEKRHNETMKIYIADVPSYIWDTSHMTRHGTTEELHAWEALDAAFVMLQFATLCSLDTRVFLRLDEKNNLI